MAVVDEKKDGHRTIAPAVEHFTAAERAARGRAARAECPRSSHASFELAPDRDPVGILEAQATSRVPELVPSVTAACSSPRSPSTAAPRR